MVATGTKVAVVGLGHQGAGMCGALLDHGYDLLGAVDVGDKVGQSLKQFVDHPDVPDLPVVGTIDALIAQRGKPDVVVLAAAAPTAAIATMISESVVRGINVLTLNEDLFEGRGSPAEELDQLAKAHGVSVIPGGLQDNLWVHLPAVAAASTSKITRLILDDFADASVFSDYVGRKEGALGLTDAEFIEWSAHRLAEPPIQGAPLRELARVLGFEPLETRQDITCFKSSTPTWWEGAQKMIPAGDSIGAKFAVTISTREGVELFGQVVFKIAECTEQQQNSIIIHGDEVLKLVLPSFGHSTVWIGILRRIPEIVAARPGLVRIAELAPPKYVHAHR